MQHVYFISFYFSFTFYCLCVITCIFLSTCLVNKDDYYNVWGTGQTERRYRTRHWSSGSKSPPPKKGRLLPWIPPPIYRIASCTWLFGAFRSQDDGRQDLYHVGRVANVPCVLRDWTIYRLNTVTTAAVAFHAAAFKLWACINHFSLLHNMHAAVYELPADRNGIVDGCFTT